MTKASSFEVVSRPHGNCWRHKNQDYWIVFYESLERARKPCFVAYRAIEPSGNRDPWTVNNRAVGRFHTLENAMELV